MGGGAPLTPLPVQVEALIGSRWRSVANVTARATGRFTATIAPKRTRALRVRYRGSPQLRPGTSPRFTVKVKPVVTLTRLPARGRAGAATTFRGRVTPREALRVAGAPAAQARALPDGRRAAAAGEARRHLLRPLRARRRRRTYRFYVVAKLDRATVRGASKAYRLGVARSRGGGAVAP